MKKRQIATLLLAGIVSQFAQAEQSRQFLDNDGVTREYQLYIPPSYDSNSQSPLLLVLHGRTSNGQRMANLTNFNARADKYGFAVAYPEGTDSQWNYLHGLSGFKEQPNDSEFLLAVIDDVSSKHNIDARRVYVTGLSNGGFMAQRLACYAPGKFTAFASVAAGGYAYMSEDCVSNGPVNMLYIHGTADEKVPWGGLAVTDNNGNQQPVTLSLTSSVKFWAERDQCSPDVVSKEIPSTGKSPGTRVRVLSSTDCLDNAAVVLYAIIGGGHNWPGAPGIIPPAIAGQVNMDIHASDVIWSFFATKLAR